MKKKINLFVLIVCILTLLRIILMINLPMKLYGQAMHDDYLLMEYAYNIISGHWLGIYTPLTLVKGISFPLYIDLSMALGIPYLFMTALLYVFSSYYFTKVIQDKIKNKWILLLIYLFLLYSPAGFASQVIQRVYRMALIYPMVIMVFTSILGMYLQRDSKSFKIHAIIGSLSLSFFYYLREDSIWILPFILLSTILLLIYFIRKKMWKKIFLTCLPIVVLIITTMTISLINYQVYGVYTVNDRSQTNFGTFIANLLKIDGDDVNKDVWVSKKQIQKVIDVSPTLASVSYVIDEIYNEDGQLHGWVSEDIGEMRGDLFVWALRDAFFLAGYYQDAKTTNEFFGKINDEIQMAFASGTLKKSHNFQFSSQVRGVSLNDLGEIMSDMFANLYKTITYQNEYINFNDVSMGGEQHIHNMEVMTNSIGIRKSNYILTIQGILENNSNNTIALIDDNDKVIAILKEGNIDITDVLVDGNQIYFGIYQNGTLIEKEDITNIDTEDVKISIEVFDIQEKKDTIIAKSKIIIWLSNFIPKLYMITSIPLCLISLIGYLYLLIMTIKNMFKRKYQNLDLMIILTGIFLSIFVLCFGITLFTQWVPEGYIFYAIGAYALVQMFIVISCYLLYYKRNYIN